MDVTSEQRKAWLEKTAESPFNLWLNAQVRAPDGGLDLDQLHEVAKRYGIDRRAQYAHLNPGQQRMTIGNILRRIVPVTEYAASSLDPHSGAETSNRPESLQSASVRDLLIMHGQILDELREREVVRTGNSPLGDYAELLFATALSWSLEGNSSAGHDALDASGLRYQIKSRRIIPRNPSRQLSAIRRLPDHTFDFLAGVLFDESYAVRRAVLIPHAVVVSRAKRVEHTNSWRFILDDAVSKLDGVRDVTAEVVRAADQL